MFDVKLYMPSFSQLQIPPPSNWQDFESLCCDLGEKKSGRILTLKKMDDKGNPKMESIYLEDLSKGCNWQESNLKEKIIIQISL